MIWHEIPGWPRYEVSEYGDIRSKDMVVNAKGGKTAVRKGRVLARILKSNGYLAVTLTDGVNRPQINVHRLVARAFIGECPLGMHVLHSDGNKSNNHYKNLRYGTPAENHIDTEKHGRRLKGSKHPRSKLDEEAVLHIRNSSRNIYELARMYNVSAAHICAVRSNRVWKHLM